MGKSRNLRGVKWKPWLTDTYLIVKIRSVKTVHIRIRLLLIRVNTVTILPVSFKAYYCMEKPNCSVFRTISVIVLDFPFFFS